MSRVLNECSFRPTSRSAGRASGRRCRTVPRRQETSSSEGARGRLGNEIVRVDGLEVDIREKQRGPLAVDRRLVADQRSE